MKTSWKWNSGFFEIPRKQYKKRDKYEKIWSIWMNDYREFNARILAVNRSEIYKWKKSPLYVTDIDE